MHHAVVHEHGVPHGNVIDQSIVIDVHGVLLLAPLAAHGEFNDVALLELELGGEIARANGWPLGIEQNPDHCAQVRSHLANARNDHAHPLVRCVAHIQAEHIRSGIHHGAQHGFGFGHRSERADNLCISHTDEVGARTGAISR